MRRRRAMFVATTLVTVASMVSELSMAVAKAAVCVGVLNWSAVMPVNAMFDETTTTGTTTTGGVGIAVGSGLGADVGTGIGALVGAGCGTGLGAGINTVVGEGLGNGVGAGTGTLEGAKVVVGAQVNGVGTELIVGVRVGAGVGAVPSQMPAVQTSPIVVGSLSSHDAPSALKVHRPVAESQPLGSMHGRLDVSEHPTVKQSPIRMSSRAKSPV